MKIPIKYIYVFFIPKTRGNRARYWYRAKIGISDNFARRRKEVKQTVTSETGRTVNVVGFGLPFIASYRWEQKIHRATDMLSAKMAGSGKTEWRYFLNIITALLAGYFGPELDYKNGDVIRFLFVAFLPIPIDFYLLMLSAFFIQCALLLTAAHLIITILKLGTVTAWL